MKAFGVPNKEGNELVERLQKLNNIREEEHEIV